MKTLGKTWAVGDIHGAYRALVQVLERSGFDKENDLLITLGDICDGWSEVSECVTELLTIKNRIDIRGNHDEWFYTWLTHGVNPVSWLQGGHSTAESYIRHATTEACPIHLRPSMGGWITNLSTVDIPKAHQDFFRKQESFYIDEKNRLFIHAGFDRSLPIRETDPTQYSWDRSLWKQAMSCTGDQKLVTADGFSEIFIGHTATVNYKEHVEGANIRVITTPMLRGGVWNLDTGAGFFGKLTIMNVDTHEYFQSDSVQDLYPEEKGRNR